MFEVLRGHLGQPSAHAGLEQAHRAPGVSRAPVVARLVPLPVGVPWAAESVLMGVATAILEAEAAEAAAAGHARERKAAREVHKRHATVGANGAQEIGCELARDCACGTIGGGQKSHPCRRLRTRLSTVRVLPAPGTLRTLAHTTGFRGQGAVKDLPAVRRGTVPT